MSARASILAAFVEALYGTTQVGGNVFRSRVLALTKGELPAIAVRPIAEELRGQTNAYVDRFLEVAVEIHNRGDEPEPASDPIAADAHSRIMGNPELAALVVDVDELGSAWELADADGAALQLTMRYLVHFRTARAAI
jgi:hypothetical protein